MFAGTMLTSCHRHEIAIAMDEAICLIRKVLSRRFKPHVTF